MSASVYGESAETAVLSILEARLEGAVLVRLATLLGRYSVTVRELTGEKHSLIVRGASAPEPASVVKLPPACAALDRVDDGCSSLDGLLGSGLEAHDCLQVLIVISDKNLH